MRTPLRHTALCLSALLFLAPAAAQAGLYEMSVTGTLTASTLSQDFPVGTPFAFQLVYDTAAPDLQPADPTFGSFGNASVPPALRSFHYQAGSYAVSLADAADFAAGSAIVITFTSVHAIDVNVFAPSLFPPLGGGPVSFHADFNDFSGHANFTSDGLPTDPTLGPGSFEGSTVSLLPPSGEVSGSNITGFTIRAVPEPSLALLWLAASLLLVRYRTNGVIFSWSCAAEKGFRR